MNKTNEIEKTLSNNQFPKHFVWNQRDKFWMPRKKGNVIGRIVTTIQLKEKDIICDYY